MILNTDKNRRLYLDKLKNQIQDFLVPFNKRYQEFPWNTVNKVRKVSLYSDIPVTINGTKFTILELVKLVKKYQTDLKSKTKISHYNYILRAYLQDGKYSKNYKKTYDIYSDIIKREFKQNNDDINFCLQILKELNKSIKNIKESEDIIMSGEEYLESLHDEIFNTNLATDCYIEALEYFADIDDDDDEEITEGGKLSSKLIYVSAKKRIKKSMSQCRKAYKAHDYKTVKGKIFEVKAIINESCKQIIELNGDITTLTNEYNTIFMGVYGLLGLPILHTPHNGPNEADIKSLLNDSKEFLKQICDSKLGCKNGKDAESLNYCKAQAKAALTKYNRLVERYVKVVTEMENAYSEQVKEEKRQAATYKESARYLLKKQAIYEACSNGEITLAEREALLENIRAEKVLYEDYIEDPMLTNAEKFKAVKFALYEKCNQGLISYSERERLVSEAFDRLMSEEAVSSNTTQMNTNTTNNSTTNDTNKAMEKMTKDAQKSLQKSTQNATQTTNNSSSIS